MCVCVCVCAGVNFFFSLVSGVKLEYATLECGGLATKKAVDTHVQRQCLHNCMESLEGEKTDKQGH